MLATDTVNCTVWEGRDVWVFARIKYIDSSNVEQNLTQAVTSSIALKVFNNEDQVGATTTVTVSTSVYDTLQTSTGWTANGGDSTGFNFKYQIAGSLIPQVNSGYCFAEFTFTMTSGTLVSLVCKLTVNKLRSL